MPQLQRPLGSTHAHSTSENVYANTTPFPNSLISEVMPTLKDTEWRLLCVVVRQTLGWVDPGTGRRKTQDWMTRTQLLQKTGRNSAAISKALDVLVSQQLLHVKGTNDKPLLTKGQRKQARGRIYYALHPQLIRRMNDETDFFRDKDTKSELTQDAEIAKSELTSMEHELSYPSKTELTSAGHAKCELTDIDSSKSELTDDPLCSLLIAANAKSELGNSPKANRTKENTKQTRPNKDFRGARSLEPCAPEINKRNIFETQDTLPLLPERRFYGRLREEGKENQEEDVLSAAARDVISAYEQGFKNQFPEKELAPLTPDVLNQLEQCRQKHGSQTLLMLLPGFFESDYVFAARNEYSLWSFLHSINVLLYGSKRFVSLTNQLANARKANSRTANSHIGNTLKTGINNENKAASQDNWLSGDWLSRSSVLEEDRLFDWRELSQLAALTPAMRGFVALYHKKYARRFPGKTPPLPFASALRRLYSVQSRYAESELARLLDVFFSCSLAHIKSQNYSLEAFVHNVDVLEEEESLL